MDLEYKEVQIDTLIYRLKVVQRVVQTTYMTNLKSLMATNKLTAVKVENINEPGRHADGGGLYLNVTKQGHKSWLYRYSLNGKRRWHGLGAYDKKTNTLAMARAASLKLKMKLVQNIDPIDQQIIDRNTLEQERKKATKEAMLRNMTFKKCAEANIDRLKPEWSNKKHGQQWTNTLTKYAYPYIGDMPVSDIEVHHIRQCLDPIWEEKTETATRVRQRIESVINYAIAMGYRKYANPAAWKGLLDNFYAKPEKVKQRRYEHEKTEQHHNALPYQEISAFMELLREKEGVAAKALEFLILTAARTSEVRFCTWDEFNIKKKEWSIPKARMKARKAHRVALSESAIALIESMPKTGDYVFTGWKVGKAMSENAMLSLLARMNRKDITVHGFRSTFRDYIGEETGYPFRLAEYALAHGLKDGAEKAYARGDMFKKRLEMMNHWANYINTPEVFNAKKDQPSSDLFH